MKMRLLAWGITSRAHHTWIARNSFETFRGSAINALAACSMTLDLFKKIWEVNMLKKLLGAAAMAAVAFAVVPASAAKMAGCSGENLEKTESATEVMADGAGKIAAQKEVEQAQEALLGGKMGACAMHLSRAMHAGTMNQAPYGGTMNQAPDETTTQPPYQSQGQWKPIQKAL
jgi:hypothetical protein